LTHQLGAILHIDRGGAARECMTARKSQKVDLLDHLLAAADPFEILGLLVFASPYPIKLSRKRFTRPSWIVEGQ
jgi:hypothetical protein